MGEKNCNDIISDFLEANNLPNVKFLKTPVRSFIVLIDNERIGIIYFKHLLGGWRLYFDSESQDEFLARNPIKTPKELVNYINKHQKLKNGK